MKKILLIGSGAREHVIAETLLRSRYEVELFVVGGTRNPGLSACAAEYLVADVCDNDSIREFAGRIAPNFAVIGPEAPIAAGVVDMLLEMGLHSASPLQSVGRLESSKSFTRDLLEKYRIAGNPRFRVFAEADGLREFMEELGGEFVVKADGLKGGKGVKVSGEHLANIEEGVWYAEECLAEAGRVLVEEKLVGQEFSLMSFCDGAFTAVMPAVQDHKRAFEGDTGPNTGGMGSYSDADGLLPFLRGQDIAEASAITQRVAAALFEETGAQFKGVMYGGFMACREGVRLIEYNARFGDPEAMNVLPLLETDFVDVCEAIIEGGLHSLDIRFARRATVCKYVVPEGYPDHAVKGVRIALGAMPEGAHVYFGSVEQREGELFLAGSRAVACVGIGENITEAEAIAEAGAQAVSGQVFHRKDIGGAELTLQRVEMMRALRG